MHTPPPDEGERHHTSLNYRAPTKPRPSEDKGFLPPTKAPHNEPDAIPSDPDVIDIMTLSPLAALKLLTATAESLGRKSREAPPTPPSSNPNTPRIQGIASHPDDSSSIQTSSSPMRGSPKDSHSNSPTSHHHHDIPHPHKTPIGSPETHPAEPPHANAPPGSLNINSAAAIEEEEQTRAQYRMLARRFYSKAPPPIGLEEYLKRLHTYCPMSTAVYLAAAQYIQRLTGSLDGISPVHSPGGLSASSQHQQSFTLPVTPKTAHRLLLAVLRVATKTLEDRTYQHVRFAKVGGVSERELARLEIGAAFLLDFDLLISPEEMRDVAKGMVRYWWEKEKEEEYHD